MQARSMFWSGLAAAGVLAAVAATTLSGWPGIARAQPTPQPQECSCSRGVNLADGGSTVVIRQCQCGILTCAVVVSSGQLQCTR